jgi:hypothetical protein
MVDNVVSTLAPERHAPEVHDTPRTQVKPLNTEKEALFDKIAEEGLDDNESAQGAFLKTFFTGLLWFGYAVAIVVAVVLVWSAAKEILH